MDLTLVFIFMTVFLVSILLFKKPTNLPPGYFGIPYIGSLSLVRKLRTERPHIVLFEGSKRFGNIFRWYIGNQFIVVLTGYDVIHEALVKKAESFSNRFVAKNPLLTGVKGEDGIIMSQYGPCWRELRRFTLQALRDFGVGKVSIEEKIQTEIEATSVVIQGTNGKPTSLNDIMQKIVANVIFGIVFGKRFDFDDPEFDKVRAMTNAVFTGPGQYNISNYMPTFIVKLLSRKDDENHRMRIQTLLELRQYIFNQITDHEATFDRDNILDFVDIYVKTDKEGDESIRKFLTRGNIYRIIVDLFLAGSETTSTTLDWAFLCMTEFPEVQNKCQDEIERVIGNKVIEYSDRNKLVYVSATVMEILRFSTTSPLSVSHVTNKDTSVGGYDIPAGSLIIPSLYSANMDTKYFPNPDKFDPERFIDESGNLIKSEALIPFSTGPRTCLGEPLARMELFLIFANLLQRFNFTREDPNKPHTLKSKLMHVTNAPAPYRLRAEKRQFVVFTVQALKKADTFSDRPTLRNPIIPKVKGGDGIVFNKYGQCWRELRRFTLQALRDFGVGKASIEEKIYTEIEALSSLLNATDGKSMSISDPLQKLVANVIFGIIFGKRYEYDDPEFDRVRTLTNVVVRTPGIVSLSNFLPKFLANLISRKDSELTRKGQHSAQEMRKYVFSQIDEHEMTFDKDNIRDFIDIYIQAEKEGDENTRRHVTKGNMFQVIVDLFLAGSETTSTTLDWAFLYMTEFPEVQQKCQDEIEKVLGDKTVEYSDRNKLVYVNATVMEIQRYSNLVPLNVSHCTTTDTTLLGYDIPAGTMIMPTIYSVTMDPKYFPHPSKFDPGRFIDESGQLMQNEALIPFSTGPRTCLGEPLARMELFLVFANLLQRFDFQMEDPARPHTLEPQLTQLTNAPYPYKLRAKRRQ